MATAIIAIAGTATLKAAVIKIGLQVAVAAGLSAFQRRKPRNELTSLQAVQGQNITVEGGSEPAVAIYGETCIGGVTAYSNSREVTDGIYELTVCTGHAYREGGNEGFTGFYLNDAFLEYPGEFASDGGPNKVFPSTEPNWSLVLPSTNPGAGVPPLPAARVLVRTGAEGETAPADFVRDFPEIDERYIGKDVTWSYWRFRLSTVSNDLFNGGPPNIRAVIKGAKVYDPRKDDTRTSEKDGFIGTGMHRFDDPATWEWSDNPSLCTADYMTQFMGLGEDRIDWGAFATAATACGQPVAIPAGAEARWRVDVVLSLFERHEANLQAIIDSCDGSLTRRNGKWALDVGGAEPASITVGLEDLVGRVAWHSNQPASQRTNVVGGQYRSRNHDWQDIDIPDRRSAFAQARDGRAIREDLALPGVSRGTQAQRLAERRLRQQDGQQRLELPMTWRGFQLQVGTRFNVDLPIFPSPKKFRVEEMSIGGDQSPIIVTAVEEEDAIWTDMAANEYHLEAPDGTITRAVTGLAPNRPSNRDRNIAYGRAMFFPMEQGEGGDPPYSYEIRGLPAELSFDPATRIISGTPMAVTTTLTNVFISSYRVTYTILDRHSDAASNTFWLRYNRDNAAVSIVGNFPFGAITRGDVQSVGLGIGPDGHTRANEARSLTIHGLPSGYSIRERRDVVDAQLIGNASPATHGQYRIRGVIVDADGDFGHKDSVFANVVGGSRPQIGAPPAVATGEAEVAIDPIQLPAATGTTGTVSYAIDDDAPLPDGLAFNATTRQITGTPVEGGTFDVRMVATDAGRSAPNNTVICGVVLIIAAAKP